MKLVVGLGNPGREYAATRHNVGWWVLDHLAEVWQVEPWRRADDAAIADGRVGAHDVRLLKPLTYMNLSGRALVPYLRDPSWSPATDLLVIVDDVALPVGRYRLRSRGSPGGHNGLRSIEATLCTRDYARLRIGIRPAGDEDIPGDLAAFVLAPFEPDEAEAVLSLMPRFTNAVERWLHEGIEAAMNLHNKQPN